MTTYRMDDIEIPASRDMSSGERTVAQVMEASVEAAALVERGLLRTPEELNAFLFQGERPSRTPDWSEIVETFSVSDIWGCDVVVSDDPEVGIMVSLTPFEGHEEPDGKIYLTEPDVLQIAAAVSRVKAGRPELNAVRNTDSDLSVLSALNADE